MIKILDSLRRNGFAIVPKVLDEPVVQDLCKVIERAEAGQAVRHRRGASFVHHEQEGEAAQSTASSKQ